MSSTTRASLSLQGRAQLFTHLGAMERAGVPVERALASLTLPSEADGAVRRFREHLAKGSDIASAGLRSGLFSPLDSSLVGAAQASGSLAAIYRRLAERYTHKAQQAAALKSRMWMPVAVLLLALFIQPLPALVAGRLSIGGYLWVALADGNCWCGSRRRSRRPARWTACCCACRCSAAPMHAAT